MTEMLTAPSTLDTDREAELLKRRQQYAAQREINVARSNAYYQTHKLEINAERRRRKLGQSDQAIKWRTDNAEHLKAYRLAYNATHKVEIKAKREANKAVIRAKSVEYRKRNVEKRKTYNKLWLKANPEKIRTRAWKRAGIELTWERYAALFNAQSQACAICCAPLAMLAKQSNNVAHVDHDHVTGEVRGLLCSNCNTMLGLARDSEAILSTGILYLRGELRREDFVA